MNQLQTEQLAIQHIDELQQTAARARLAREIKADRATRHHANTASTFGRACAASRHWFARAQLGPANNYVAR